MTREVLDILRRHMKEVFRVRVFKNNPEWLGKALDDLEAYSKALDKVLEGQ